MMHFFKKSLNISGLAVLQVFFLSACATSRLSSPGDTTTALSGDESKALQSLEPGSVEEVIARDQKMRAPLAGQPKEIVVLGKRLQNINFDFPVTLNTRVEFWVDYFTGRGRAFFEKALARSDHFIPFITPLLKENNLPSDLVYLAMIESGFNNHAKSHAKAVGPWQFISATGKRYGLSVNWWVDERRDTRKSTLAAIRYLRDLYQLFQSWELAASAYNAGESKVARAIRRYGTTDFWELSRHRYLRQETRNYVPKIIAAALVAKNREQFGFAPALVGDQILENPHVNKKGALSVSGLVEVELEGPVDLFRIASATGLEYTEIKSFNPELLRWCTPPAQTTYRLRIPSESMDQLLARSQDKEFHSKAKFVSYTVRKGETLGKIARQFGIKTDALSDLNRLSERSLLSRGTVVMIPLPGDHNRGLASLEVRDPPERRRAPTRRVAKRHRSARSS